MLRFSTAGESHGEALVANISGLPAGIAISRSEPVSGGVVLYLTAAKAASGLRGNLQLSAIIELPTPQAKTKVSTQTLLLPALPFEVLATAAQPDAIHDSAALPQQK